MSAGQAMGSVGQAMFGPPQQQYNYNGNWITPNIGGSIGPTTTIEPAETRTPLELFEALANHIQLLEKLLKLDTKDENKQKWLEKLMGLVQEHELNQTVKRLKALKI
jgi:hypothetical protein